MCEPVGGVLECERTGNECLQRERCVDWCVRGN